MTVRQLVNLPSSKEEFLVFVLENNRANSMIGLLRLIYKYLAHDVNVVPGILAKWIYDNWDWVVDSFDFDSNGLNINFAVTHVTIGNEWCISKNSVIEEELNLYRLALDKKNVL